MAVNGYKYSALTGGGAGALDSLDGAGLVDGDIALVMTGGVLYVYVLDDDSGAAESSLAVIAPDTNAGTKRWIRANPSTAVGDAQEWQHPTRAAETVYQNTTGKAIQVNIVIGGGSVGGTVHFRVGPTSSPSVDIAYYSADDNPHTQFLVSAIIPNNHYYKLSLTGDLTASWSELR